MFNKEEFNDIKFKGKLNSQDKEQIRNSEIELDLSVPNHKDNLRMSGSILSKTPDFFKKLDISEEIKNSRYQENTENNNFNYEMRFNRNKSLHNATLNQEMSSGFYYQNDLYSQYSEDITEHSDGFYQSQAIDPISQRNNLFGQQFPHFNKKRSFSEADLNKSNRYNPFLNFKRNSQYNDDHYSKLSRQIPETCIDPRMFYKNLSVNSHFKNKENHSKPAFSYAQIITRALNGSHDGKLSLGEIYKWIEDNFEYYKYANPVWKNSIRHNLSLSKCFKKVAREPGTRGKGGKWMIDQEFIAREEQRKKRKNFESENIMSYNSYDLNPEDSRFYQM